MISSGITCLVNSISNSHSFCDNKGDVFHRGVMDFNPISPLTSLLMCILTNRCGSGLSGEALTENGHYWVGLDISTSMLGKPDIKLILHIIIINSCIFLITCVKVMYSPVLEHLLILGNGVFYLPMCNTHLCTMMHPSLCQKI